MKTTLLFFEVLATKLIILIVIGGITLLACDRSTSVRERPKEDNSPDADAIEVSFEGGDFPDVNLKRGYILRDALDRLNNNILSDLRRGAKLGMDMVLLPRDLNQFDPKWDTGTFDDYYLSYRSKGNIFFGGDGEEEEFIRNSPIDIQVSVNSQFLEYVKEAKDLGLQVVIQVSGSPVEGKDDGSVEQIFQLDQAREFHESARFYPIPASSDINTHADVVFKWMKMIKDKVNLTDAIWIGQQEPTHTLGYPNGQQNIEESRNNIFSYADVWKPISEKLNQNNMMVGGLQLNESRRYYIDGVEAIESKQIPVDFFTIQNYRANRNSLTINEALKRMDNTASLNGKKILFNRYNYKSDLVNTNQEMYNSSLGIIEYLKAEIQLFKRADRVYGYNIFNGAQGEEMLEELFTFLNSAPIERKTLSNLPNRVQGFALADESKLAIALWNESSGTIETDIILDGFPDDFSNKAMNATLGSGTRLQNSRATWVPKQAFISDLILDKNEFILIEVN